MSTLKKPTLTTRQRAAIIRAATLASVQQRDRWIREVEAEVQQLYAETAQSIVEHIQQAGNDDGRIDLAQMQAVLQYVNSQLSQMSRKRDGRLMDAIARSASLGSSAFAGVLQADRLTHANHSAVAFVRGFVAEDGLQLSDRLWRLDRGAKEVLADHIQHAVIHGESAFEAMQRSMGRGEGVPDDIAGAVNAAKVGKLGPSVRALMTGAKDPRNGKGVVYQAQRVFNTELMRVHGESYMSAGFATDGVVGVRFNLSPNHKKVDVCDRHASADLHNLGAGVYPSREACPWPAHPNTWSYVTVVFDYEVEEYRAELKKNEALDIKDHSADELIKRGELISARLAPDGIDEGFSERLHRALSAIGRAGYTAQNMAGNEYGLRAGQIVSQNFPKSWIKISDHAGKTTMNYLPNERGLHRWNGKNSAINFERYDTAVHEFTHRMQRVIQGLDARFQEIHEWRTIKDAQEHLNQLLPLDGYAPNEVSRKDDYIHPYFGKEYGGKGSALEVMTMSFEHVLSSDIKKVQELFNKDRELFDLVMGALFHYDPPH